MEPGQIPIIGGTKKVIAITLRAATSCPRSVGSSSSPNLLGLGQIAKKLWENWLLLPGLLKCKQASKNQSPRGDGRAGRELAKITQLTCFSVFPFLKGTLILRSVAEPITQHRFQTSNYSGCFCLNIAGGKQSCSEAVVSVTTTSCAMLIK